MDIYIKPVDKAQIVGRKLVYLRDVAEIFVSGQANSEIGNLVVLKIPNDRKGSYLITVIDLIKAITNHWSDATVSNVGAMDVVVEYKPKPEKQNNLLLYLKVAFVFFILLAGASTAIMSFHSDAQMPKIFENYYYIFFGQNNDMPSILTIPYTIGLGVGIIVFFNHFSKFYITNDPTPIEVEMTTYEKETVASVVDALNKRSQQNQKSGEHS